MVRAERDFAYTRYHVVNRRVRSLKERGYIEKYGEERAEKIPITIPLYQLTPRAYLAILLNRIDLDKFVEKAPEGKILSALVAFVPEDRDFDTHV